MVVRIQHAALALALSMGAFAGACGPATPAADAPASEGQQAGAAPSAATAGAAAPEAPKPEGEAAREDKEAHAHEHGARGKSTPLQATQMEAELKKIGIDLAKIPELEKLPLAQKKKVMPLLQKSLGYDSCQGCHAEGDFKKETRDMKVAREMWRHFVVPLRTEQGGLLFCDSCHAGKEHVLDRSDKEALKEFMDAEYEHKLAQASKADMECTTCHGGSMEMKIIERLWNIPKP